MFMEIFRPCKVITEEESADENNNDGEGNDCNTPNGDLVNWKERLTGSENAWVTWLHCTVN